MHVPAYELDDLGCETLSSRLLESVVNVLTHAVSDPQPAARVLCRLPISALLAHTTHSAVAAVIVVDLLLLLLLLLLPLLLLQSLV